MKFHYAVLLWIALSLGGCATVQHGSAGDPYSRLMIGTWRSEHQDSYGNLFSYSEKTYGDDGVVTGFILFLGRSPQGPALRKITFEGKWLIRDGILETTALSYDPPSSDDLAVVRDRIVNINEDTAEFESLADGALFSRRKVR